MSIFEKKIVRQLKISKLHDNSLIEVDFFNQQGKLSYHVYLSDLLG